MGQSGEVADVLRGGVGFRYEHDRGEMVYIQQFQDRAAIPSEASFAAAPMACMADASAGKTGLKPVYVEHATVEHHQCVVVSGLTYCVGLILRCEGNHMVVCHFNGGHGKESSWEKIREAVGGRVVEIAIMIINPDKEGSRDRELLSGGVATLNPTRTLSYAPSEEAVNIALFGDGRFGEVAWEKAVEPTTHCCCIVM